MGGILTRVVSAERALREAWRRDLDARTGSDPLRLLGCIVVLAAALRFATLGARGFWVDEAVVVNLIDLGVVDMTDALLSGTEGSPPLYYLLALGWTNLLGSDSEVALRALSAVLGTATVPVAYLAGRALASSGAGLLAAAVFALNPVLVWHSQDARAHSLAVLLSALALLFFLRALREPRGRDVALWAVTAVLGVLSHYFVGFVVAVEAAWLLLAFHDRRAVRAAVAALAVGAVAALAIALEQRSNVDLTYGAYGGLPSRLVQAPAQLLVGEQPPLQRLTAVVAALLAAVAAAGLFRGATASRRRAAVIPAALAGLAVAGMLLAALAGADYVSARNLLPALLPIVLVACCGVGVKPPRLSRGALVGLAGLAAVWLAINVVTARVPKFEREDWRGAAEALGPPARDRAVVVTPYPGRGPLRIYLPGLKRMPKTGAVVQELDVIGLAPLLRKVGRAPVPPRPAGLPPVPAGFRLVERRQEKYFTILRFQSRVPRMVGRDELAEGRLGAGPPEVMFQRR